MVAVISLLLVLSISVLITRIATVALTHTGLSRESARFQARSAFTGAGFTTNESERVVNHPVRRRIVLLLMLMGNAGIVTAVSSLILTFVQQGDGGGLPLMWKVALLIVGVTLLWLVAASSWVDRRLSHLIDRLLRRHTSLDVRDFHDLMHLKGEYRLSELSVEPGDWLAERTLGDLALREEGVVVLGITRKGGDYLGAPEGDTLVSTGDNLLVYARTSSLERLDERRRDRQGDREHERAVREQDDIAAREREADDVPKRGRGD